MCLDLHGNLLGAYSSVLQLFLQFESVVYITVLMLQPYESSRVEKRLVLFDAASHTGVHEPSYKNYAAYAHSFRRPCLDHHLLRAPVFSSEAIDSAQYLMIISLKRQEKTRLRHSK